MILYGRLRLLARALYGNDRLPSLLSAWAARDPDGELERLLLGTGLDVGGLERAVAPLREAPPDPDDAALVSRCLRAATGGATTGRHLLRALCREPDHRVTRELVGAGLDPGRILERLEGDEERGAELMADLVAPPTAIEDRPLTKYGRDLTKLAREGSFDDREERGDLLDRILPGLLGYERGCVMLTGDPGTGKTAQVECLARRVARGEVPPPLRRVGLFELDLGALVAGSRYRGDFEERLKSVLRAAEACEHPEYDRIVLFIDEAHLIFGAGRAEGVITDAANLLKPALARGTIRVIGATTDAEYQRYIVQGDPALARRFTRIPVEAPTGAELFAIVRRKATALGTQHQVRIEDRLVRDAIEITDRNQPGRSQPDKAVQLLDGAAVDALTDGRSAFDRSHLLRRLANDTGRPIAVLDTTSRGQLLELEEELNACVVAQPQAARTVAHKLIQSRQDLGASGRTTLGGFLFAGAPGVGKTEMARTINRLFFGRTECLLRVDLAEYASADGVNKLLGAPPGYGGQPGVLVNFLQQREAGTLLFDEAEKAHPAVVQVLLGLLEGQVTSGHGQKLDTRACVVCLTTNALKQADLRQRAIGFAKSREADPTERLGQAFSPELLDRLDAIVVFNALGPADLRRVLELRLDEALQRLQEKGVHLRCERERLLEHLTAQLGSRRGSARDAARLIEETLLQPVGLALLREPGVAPFELELAEDYYRTGAVRRAEQAAHG